MIRKLQDQVVLLRDVENEINEINSFNKNLNLYI